MRHSLCTLAHLGSSDCQSCLREPISSLQPGWSGSKHHKLIRCSDQRKLRFEAWTVVLAIAVVSRVHVSLITGRRPLQYLLSLTIPFVSRVHVSVIGGRHPKNSFHATMEAASEPPGFHRSMEAGVSICMFESLCRSCYPVQSILKPL